jgi:hypothetical protein
MHYVINYDWFHYDEIEFDCYGGITDDWIWSYDVRVELILIFYIMTIDF